MKPVNSLINTSVDDARITLEGHLRANPTGAGIHATAGEGASVMIHLEPCPFCGQEPEQRSSKYNPYARCATPDCAGGKLPLISLDVPEDIERWNRRYREQALVADVEMLSELLRRMVAAMHAYEMDVDWDHPPPRDHRAMMADAYSATEATSTTSLARMRDERAQAIQQAVKRARMEWAREDKAELDRLKAQWQADGASAVGAYLVDQHEEKFPGGEVQIAGICQAALDKLRRQAEEAQQ